MITDGGYSVYFFCLIFCWLFGWLFGWSFGWLVGWTVVYLFIGMNGSITTQTEIKFRAHARKRNSIRVRSC